MLSIVTISYNQGKYLRRCVESIRAQGFSNFEHIIVDAGSSDDSREWLESHPNQNTVHIFESDNGPANGLNKGLAAATGDVFLYLNADDEMAPGSLSFISEWHQKSAASVLIANGWTIDEDGRPIAYIKSDRFSAHRYALGVGTVLQQGTSFKMNFLKSQGISFNESNRGNWDTELLFDCSRAGAVIAYAAEVTGYFRLQGESITMGGRHEALLRAERQRLASQVAVGRIRPRALVQAAPRAIKAAGGLIRRQLAIPEFPGLVQGVV